MLKLNFKLVDSVQVLKGSTPADEAGVHLSLIHRAAGNKIWQHLCPFSGAMSSELQLIKKLKSIFLPEGLKGSSAD